MREPTNEEIRTHARIEWTDQLGKPVVGYACWYPQMGGYVGKCIVVPIRYVDSEKGSGCFEAYVWHDGEFAFSGEASEDGEDARNPVHLHHCDAEQFISFGEFMAGLL